MKMQDLLKENMELKQMFTSVKITIAQQSDTIHQLNQTISELNITIEDLKEMIEELQCKRNKNSRNSSKPPSSDGLAKPKSLRRPSGKEPGGQKGHKGQSLTLTTPPDQTIMHRPKECENCPRIDTCVSCAKSATRNVIDVEIKTVVTAHCTESYACPLRQGSIISGEFPESINSSLQ